MRRLYSLLCTLLLITSIATSVSADKNVTQDINSIERMWEFFDIRGASDQTDLLESNLPEKLECLIAEAYMRAPFDVGPYPVEFRISRQLEATFEIISKEITEECLYYIWGMFFHEFDLGTLQSVLENRVGYPYSELIRREASAQLLKRGFNSSYILWSILLYSPDEVDRYRAAGRILEIDRVDAHKYLNIVAQSSNPQQQEEAWERFRGFEIDPKDLAFGLGLDLPPLYKGLACELLQSHIDGGSYTSPTDIPSYYLEAYSTCVDSGFMTVGGLKAEEESISAQISSPDAILAIAKAKYKDIQPTMLRYTVLLTNFQVPSAVSCMIAKEFMNLPRFVASNDRETGLDRRLGNIRHIVTSECFVEILQLNLTRLNNPELLRILTRRRQYSEDIRTEAGELFLARGTHDVDELWRFLVFFPGDEYRADIAEVIITFYPEEFLPDPDDLFHSPFRDALSIMRRSTNKGHQKFAWRVFKKSNLSVSDISEALGSGLPPRYEKKLCEKLTSYLNDEYESAFNIPSDYLLAYAHCVD